MALLKAKKRKKLTREEQAALFFPSLASGPDLSPGPAVEFVDAPKYADDFDIVGLMAGAEDPDTGLIRDLKIDDRDLASAKNYYDYSFNIIGKDANPPWLIQMWIGLILMGEVCPCCSDKRWLDLGYIVEYVDKAMPSVEIIDHLQVLENGKCPKCKRTKYDLLTNHNLRNYQELVNVLGQRSGKSSSAAGGYCPYLTHRYLKFPKLASLATNAMQKSTELTGTFVSLTFSKAESLLWTPYTKHINESSWFQAYHELLDFYGEKYGVELYRKKDLFHKYFNKNLKFYPTHPNGPILRGDTRVWAVIDELGLFPLPSGKDEEDEQSSRANADEAHKSLTNSLTTVQAININLLKAGINAPPALMMGVSSPMSIRDKVMRLLADSKTPDGEKYILGVQLPTWKVNPTINRDTPIIALAYARNPEKAERDFGANPPRVHSAFVGRSTVKYELFTQKPSHNLVYVYDQPGMLSARVEKIRSVNYPSLVTIDAGSVDNSFCLTGGHYNFDTGKTEVSTILECMPHEGRRIDFNLMYKNVILPVCKDLNAVALLADQWQSLDLLHRTKEDMGLLPDGKPRCLTKQHSPRRKNFDTLVAMLENMNLLLPWLPREQYDSVMDGSIIDFRLLNGKPVQHLVLQILTVRDLGVGKTPGKGEGFTDDIFRALVLQTLIHEEKIMARLKNAVLVDPQGQRKGMPMPSFAGRSGGFRSGYR